MRAFGRGLAILGILAVWAAPAAADKLRVGVLKLASSGPVFIAIERGYFGAAGLDVELKYFDAAQPIAVAVMSGDLDIGITGLTGGFYNLAGKGALKIIAAQSREEPGYHLIAYLAGNRAFAAGLTELAKLPGHSVGMTQIGSTFHYSIGLLAEKLGFPLERLRLVPLQSMTNAASALKGGQVDAALLPATVALPMISRQEAHLLGWVGDETPWQLGAVFAAGAVLDHRRSEVALFLSAYVHGAHDFHDALLARDAAGQPKPGADAPAVLDILAKYTGQAADQLRLGIPYIDPDAKLLVRDIHRQVEWYQAQGLVDHSVDPSRIVDLSFIPGQE